MAGTTWQELQGLLDSGTSVSSLGKVWRELLEKIQILFRPYHTTVQTVSGAAQNVFGKISIPVHYKGIFAEMTLFICPFLEQEIYLGVDFWREFGIAPQILSLEEITPEKDGKQKKIESWRSESPFYPVKCTALKGQA